MRPAQKRSARSRSEGACENWTEQAIPMDAKRLMSSAARHWQCSIRWRSPSGLHTPRVASKASSASRLARSPIAWTATGQPAAAPARMISASSPPLVIRNAPTPLMKEIGYGAGYRYAHDQEGRIADQQHLPDELIGRRFYEPSEEGYEAEIARRMREWEKLLAQRRSDPQPPR